MDEACGAKSKVLDVHIIMGGAPREAPCTDAGATRAAWNADAWVQGGGKTQLTLQLGDAKDGAS